MPSLFRRRSHSDEQVRVHFSLEPDESGWPPVGGETLWADPVGPNLFRLDNTPWFVRGVSCYDIVEAAPRWRKSPEFVRVVERSGHLTVRVALMADRSLEAMTAVISDLNQLGVACEGDQDHGLIALDIPPTTSLPPVKKHLDEGVQDGTWEFEEGLINDSWLSL